MLKTRWPAVPIEDLCSRVTSGGTPSRSNPAYYDGGTIPWIKTGELRGWYVDDVAERITPAAVRESSAKVFPAETVLLAMYGDGKTMGSVGLIRTPAATNQACCAMLADQQKCDPKFLMYSLVYFKPAILKLAISGAQRNLNGKSIKQFSIGAPPVEVQKRIASILSAYDDLIENNTRRIAILEEMARRIYEEWFVRFRFPGHEGARMVESELGMVPQGWNVAPLGNVAKLLSGFAFKSTTFVKDGDFGLVTIKNVHDGAFIANCSSRLSRPPGNMPTHCTLNVADILLSLTGNVGRCCLVPVDGCLLNQRVAKIQPVKAFDWAYSYLMFRSSELKERLEAIANGVAQQNLSPIETQRILVLLPPEELRQRFANTATEFLRLALTLQRGNTNLRTTRDLLLPRLISGELGVSTLSEPEALAA